MQKATEHYKNEKKIFNKKYAVFSEKHILSRYRGSEFDDSKGEKEKTSYRTPFMRDCDRIIHSESFRRMANKTQIYHTINLSERYRTRLSHTMEVFQIARSIGKTLGLNIYLIEAIALGHDLGHTPFGHKGERTLDEILRGEDLLSGRVISANLGFKHNFQSVRLVDSLEEEYSDYRGLNLTWFVREGIFKHTTSKGKKYYYVNKDEIDYEDECEFGTREFSASLEGQVVAIADEIAQITHDIEDAMHHKIIIVEDFLKSHKRLLKRLWQYNRSFNEEIKRPNVLSRRLLNSLIKDVCENSIELLKKSNNVWEGSNEKKVISDNYIKFKPDTKEIVRTIHADYVNSSINSECVSKMDGRAEYIIRKLFKAYVSNPNQLPHKWWIKYFDKIKSNVSNGIIKLNDDFIKEILGRYCESRRRHTGVKHHYPILENQKNDELKAQIKWFSKFIEK